MKIYGIHSSVSKRYCWFVQANYKGEARKFLETKIGMDARKYRFSIREIQLTEHGFKKIGGETEAARIIVPHTDEKPFLLYTYGRHKKTKT